MAVAAVLEVDHDPPQELRAVGDRAPSDRERSQAAGAESVRTVLIVEDEPGLRESLGEILRIEGYETAEAGDGEAGLAILRNRHIDVLILDLHLPKLDGYSLLQQIDPPPPMVIIHSAFEFFSPEEVRQGVGSKVFRMVRKPIPPPQLLAAVSEAIAELDGRAT